MDYKELIGRYRLYATRWENGEQLLLNGEMRIQDNLRESATAIETLLVERDAAVIDLADICEENPDACHICKHMPCTGNQGRCIGWEWRGVK